MDEHSPRGGGRRGRKHVLVREYVRSVIVSAEPGTPAPSERDLAEQFGVARMTVRHAIDALVAQGLLERVAGRGTFVTKPLIDMQMRLSAYTEEMERRGKKPESKTLLARRESRRSRRRPRPGDRGGRRDRALAAAAPGRRRPDGDPARLPLARPVPELPRRGTARQPLLLARHARPDAHLGRGLRAGRASRPRRRPSSSSSSPAPRSCTSPAARSAARTSSR